MQKIQMICALFVLASVNIVAGQVVGLGRCPRNVEPFHGLDFSKLLGTWHEYARYPFAAEGRSRCNHAVYGPNSNNSITVENTQLGRGNKKTVFHGVATVIGDGVASVRYEGISALAIKFMILGTDYENFFIKYGCNNLGLAHAQTLWIFTRERFPSEKVIKAAKDVIEANKISLAPLTVTDHVDC